MTWVIFVKNKHFRSETFKCFTLGFLEDEKIHILFEVSNHLLYQPPKILISHAPIFEILMVWNDESFRKKYHL